MCVASLRTDSYNCQKTPGNDNNDDDDSDDDDDDDDGYLHPLLSKSMNAMLPAKENSNSIDTSKPSPANDESSE